MYVFILIFLPKKNLTLIISWPRLELFESASSDFCPIYFFSFAEIKVPQGKNTQTKTRAKTN